MHNSCFIVEMVFGGQSMISNGIYLNAENKPHARKTRTKSIAKIHKSQTFAAKTSTPKMKTNKFPICTQKRFHRPPHSSPHRQFRTRSETPLTDLALALAPAMAANVAIVAPVVTNAAASPGFGRAVPRWPPDWGCGGDRKPTPRGLAPPREMGCWRARSKGSSRRESSGHAAAGSPTPAGSNLPADSGLSPRSLVAACPTPLAARRAERSPRAMMHPESSGSRPIGTGPRLSASRQTWK